MTLCNLSIEGGARMGYVNPDDTTFAFLRGPPARAGRRRLGSGRRLVAQRWHRDAAIGADDERVIDVSRIAPVVTWGTNPGQSVAVDEPIPDPRGAAGGEREAALEALQFMGFEAGESVQGRRVDVAFIGSCTNARLSDLRAAADVVRGQRLARHVRGLVVPGSREVQRAAEREGLHEVFEIGRIRVARARLLALPGHERRQAVGRPDLRLVVEPQLPRASGQPDRPHAADEPGNGRGRGHRRRGRGRAQRDSARRSGAMSGVSNRFGRGPRPAARRRRHRHRSDHAGPPPARHHVRRVGAAPLRRRPRARGRAGGGRTPLTIRDSPARR